MSKNSNAHKHLEHRHLRIVELDEEIIEKDTGKVLAKDRKIQHIVQRFAQGPKDATSEKSATDIETGFEEEYKDNIISLQLHRMDTLPLPRIEKPGNPEIEKIDTAQIIDFPPEAQESKDSSKKIETKSDPGESPASEKTAKSSVIEAKKETDEAKHLATDSSQKIQSKTQPEITEKQEISPETDLQEKEAIVEIASDVSPESQSATKKSTEQKAKKSEKKKRKESTKDRVKEFHPSRFTIKFKLLTIISLIMITSFSVMIYLATNFFRQDNETRVKENNHRLAEIIASKIITDLKTLSDKTKLVAAIADENRTGARQEEMVSNFFQNNPEIIFVGIGQKGTELKFSRELWNEKNLLGDPAVKKNYLDILQSNQSQFLSSFYGKNTAVNLSVGTQQPILGLSLPFQREAQNYATIVVVLLRMDSMLKTFETTGITQAFMVNVRGDVVAHPDPKIVFARSNFQDLGIVKQMLTSKLDNGQTRYRDKDGLFYLGSFKKIPFADLGVITTAQEEKAFEEVYNIQRRNIYILIIGLNLAILIIYFFAKSISNPIIRLVGATKQIEQGNYSLDIRPSTTDEIGSLTYSFLNMSKGLEEREKMKDAFGKFVNKEIAEQAMRGEIKLGGERKIVAIFFSDIRGFTAISENLEPEEVVEFLNEYMTEMVACINQTHGVVDKFIGDAIMAHWGAIASRGNDTENAINAAIMMRTALKKFNESRGQDIKKPIIKFGCGINTGPVISGQIGSDERLEYTVIGDAVNLASRVEGLNKPFGTDILITEDSYNVVKDIYNVEQMPSIKVKGKEEPQTIYAVLGRKDDPNCPSSVDQIRKEMHLDYDPNKKVDANAKEEKFEVLQ